MELPGNNEQSRSDEALAPETRVDLSDVDEVGVTSQAVRDQLLRVTAENDPENAEESWVPDFGRTQLFMNAVLQGIPSGDAHRPSLVLEVGGGDRVRPYPASVLREKHLVVGNIDRFPTWGDRRLRCDLEQLVGGLNDPCLEDLFKDVKLGAVVMTHVLSHLDPDTAKTLIDSAAAKLEPGGKIVILDKNTSSGSAMLMRQVLYKQNKRDDEIHGERHALDYGRNLKAFKYLEQVGSADGFRFNRYSLGYALPDIVLQRMEGDWRATLKRAKTLFPAEGTLVRHPVTDATANDVHMVARKTLHPAYAECMIEVEKLDPQKELLLKQRQRALERKARDERKKKRKR